MDKLNKFKDLDSLWLHRFSGDNLKLPWDLYYIQEWKRISKKQLHILISKECIRFNNIAVHKNLPEDFIIYHIGCFKKFYSLPNLFRRQRINLDTLEKILKVYPKDKNQIINSLFYYPENPNADINVIDKYIEHVSLSCMAYKKEYEPVVDKYFDLIYEKLGDSLIYCGSFSENFLMKHLTSFSIDDIISYQVTISDEFRQRLLLLKELEK